jgi:hypothetical protein
METVMEKMMDPGEHERDFVVRVGQHDFVAGEFFKGYAN